MEYVVEVRALVNKERVWRNGSASDSSPEGCEFDSRHPQRVCGVGVSMEAFQAFVPGSSPGRRIYINSLSLVGRAWC